MNQKTCKLCQIDKTTDNFNIVKTINNNNIIKIYYQSYCKSCQSLQRKKWAEENPEKLKKWKKENKSKLRASEKKYRDNNLDKVKLCKQKYKQNNKDKIAIYNRNYRIKNSEKQQLQFMIRMKNDIKFRLKKTISRSVLKQLKVNGSSKEGKSISKYLKYTIAKLKEHLESLFELWMTWENHGKYNSILWNDNDSSTWTWQIDHIIPHSTFKYTSMEDEDFQKCWALDNLRPLSSKQNIIDGASRVRHQ